MKKILSILIILVVSIIYSYANENIIDSIVEGMEYNNSLMKSSKGTFIEEQKLSDYARSILESSPDQSQIKKNWSIMGITPFYKESEFAFTKNKTYGHTTYIPSIEREGAGYEVYSVFDGANLYTYAVGDENASLSTPVDQTIFYNLDSSNPLILGRIISPIRNINVNKKFKVFPPIRYQIQYSGKNIQLIGTEKYNGVEHYVIKCVDAYYLDTFSYIKAWIDPLKGYLARRIEIYLSKDSPHSPNKLVSSFEVREFDFIQLGNEKIWFVTKCVFKDYYSLDSIPFIEREITFKDYIINEEIPLNTFELPLPDNIQYFQKY